MAKRLRRTPRVPGQPKASDHWRTPRQLFLDAVCLGLEKRRGGEEVTVGKRLTYAELIQDKGGVQ